MFKLINKIIESVLDELIKNNGILKTTEVTKEEMDYTKDFDINKYDLTKFNIPDITKIKYFNNIDMVDISKEYLISDLCKIYKCSELIKKAYPLKELSENFSIQELIKELPIEKLKRLYSFEELSKELSVKKLLSAYTLKELKNYVGSEKLFGILKESKINLTHIYSYYELKKEFTFEELKNIGIDKSSGELNSEFVRVSSLKELNTIYTDLELKEKYDMDIEKIRLNQKEMELKYKNKIEKNEIFEGLSRLELEYNKKFIKLVLKPYYDKLNQNDKNILINILEDLTKDFEIKIDFKSLKEKGFQQNKIDTTFSLEL